MSRYFYHKTDPIDGEIKTWLAQNFDLAEMRHSNTCLRTLKDKIIPQFQQFIGQLSAENKQKLIDNDFVTTSYTVTTHGIIYLLYLASSSSIDNLT